MHVTRRIAPHWTAPHCTAPHIRAWQWTELPSEEAFSYWGQISVYPSTGYVQDIGLLLPATPAKDEVCAFAHTHTHMHTHARMHADRCTS